MEMTEAEYKDFLNSFSLASSTLKQWLNDVILLEGINFPYRLDEFRTDLSFLDKQMHFLLEVEPGAYEWLDEEFIEE